MMESTKEKRAMREEILVIEKSITAAMGHATTNESKVAMHELGGSFSRLVQMLALGPEPEVRNCPQCGKEAMIAATLCGHCWAHLIPVAGAA